MRMRFGKSCVNVSGCGLVQSLKEFQHPNSTLTSLVGNPGGQSLLPSDMFSCAHTLQGVNAVASAVRWHVCPQQQIFIPIILNS